MPSKLLNSGDQAALTRGPFADFVDKVEKIDPVVASGACLTSLGGKTCFAVNVGQVCAL